MPRRRPRGCTRTARAPSPTGRSPSCAVRRRSTPVAGPFGRGDVVIATLRDAAIDADWQIRTARAHGARVIELDCGPLAVPHPARRAGRPAQLARLSRTTRSATCSTLPGSAQELGLVRPAGERRRAPAGRARGSRVEHRLDVALLVEHVGREREVEAVGPRTRASRGPRRRGSRPFRAAFSRSSSIASSAQSVAVTVAPRAAATSDGTPSPQPSSTTRSPSTSGSASASASRGRPELGPVRQELVVARTPPRRSAPPATRAGAASSSTLADAERVLAERLRAARRGRR